MHKKLLASTFILVMLTMLLAMPALAANYKYVKIVELKINNQLARVNAQPVKMEQAPYVKQSRTLVPFRFLAETLGAIVTWDNKTRTAGLSLNGKVVNVTLGSKIAKVNGVNVMLDVPAELKGNRTFIPLRFVSEALGAEVEYEDLTQAVTVTMISTRGWNQFQDPNGGNLIYPKDWTIAGDTNTTLRLNGPSGTEVLLSLVPEEARKVLAEKKAAYAALGFLQVQEDPFDPEDPTAGSVVGMIKPNAVSLDTSEASLLIISTQPEGTYIYEVKSSVAQLDIDLLLLEKMMLSEADFLEWKLAQSAIN